MSGTMASPSELGDSEALDRLKQQRAWNWYDWANSAFYTTTLTVLFGPYLSTVAARAAGCAKVTEECSRPVHLLGIPLAAGSLALYVTSAATLLSALVLPIIGAMVDRSSRKKLWMAGFAWAGSIPAGLLFFLQGAHWAFGVGMVMLASILAGCSLVSYYAILVDISTEEERDRASSRGWAFGYLGGGLLLLLNLVLVQLPGAFGMDTEMAVRISMLSAAVWWAGFTFVPYLKLRDHEPRHVLQESGGLVSRSFGQLWGTLREMRQFPMTLTFLLAYLFYNDGIQTVIYAANIYADKTLGLSTGVRIAAILMIQFVAFGGALAFSRIAARHGAYRSILWGVFAWVVIVVLGMFLPAHNVPLFLALGIAIGLVMGGTQALSRSFFSLLIPRGREGEYFSLYNAGERGTSWFGMLLFGLIFQIAGSYRPAIVTLSVFFVLGAVFLLRLDPARGIREAGNRLPAAV